jgi:hypothetical protein
MQECCFRLQLAGKRKSTQLLCAAAILLLVIVNAALYIRSLEQTEQLERLKKELVKSSVKRAVEPQINAQASSPSLVPPPKLPPPVAPLQVLQAAALPINPSAAPDMIALDRALFDALSSMASACASTTTCYPHCDTPAAPAQVYQVNRIPV